MKNGRKGKGVEKVPSLLKNGFKETLEKIRSLPQGKKRRGSVSVRHRPAVKVTGPKVRNLKCTMCMGYIKVGLQYAVCECGETYHVVCLSRTGFCPICNRKWEEKDIPAISKVNGDSCSAPNRKDLECPSCGEAVSYLDLECHCGAIFVKENDSFLCPECGGRVGLNDMVCMGCGERFRECEIVTCPECGKRFDAMDGACECGTFIGDECPECGAVLGANDSFCPKCGAKIEDIVGS